MDEGKLLLLFRQVVREELGVQQQLVFSIPQAARRLGVSERTVRRLVHAGQLLTVVVGQTPKVPLAELQRLATPRHTASMPEAARAPRAVVRGKISRLASREAALEELRRLRSKRR